VLFDLLPAAFEPWGASAWYRSAPPTDLSLRRIEAELGFRPPALFVEVARACPAYGGWFGSIGDDFDNHNHLVRINQAFREEGLSPRYVLLNHGHDGDCDAWDTDARPGADGELPIVSFSYDGERRALAEARGSVASFADYIDAFVRTRAPRCPVPGLRRRAKRILAPFCEPGG
jgi:hypothetical protein